MPACQIPAYQTPWLTLCFGCKEARLARRVPRVVWGREGNREGLIRPLRACQGVNAGLICLWCPIRAVGGTMATGLLPLSLLLMSKQGHRLIGPLVRERFGVGPGVTLTPHLLEKIILLHPAGSALARGWASLPLSLHLLDRACQSPKLPTDLRLASPVVPRCLLSLWIAGGGATPRSVPERS